MNDKTAGDQIKESLRKIGEKMAENERQKKEANERKKDNERQVILDHFAGLAIHGLVTALSGPFGYENTTIDGIAKESYDIAKAMLKARKEIEP